MKVTAPEFASNGKAQITARQLHAHQMGLAALDEKVDLAMVRDPSRLAQLLARFGLLKARPASEPGSAAP